MISPGKALAILALAAGFCALPPSAAAQSDPDAGLPPSELLDASIPTRAVDEGGADRNNQESEDAVGRTQSFCRSDPECDRGFRCHDNRCTWSGVRRADNGGCVLGLNAGVLLALGLAWGSRGASRRSRS